MKLIINGRLITRDAEGRGYYEHGAVAYEGARIAEVGEEAALRAALCAFLAELPPDHLGRLCQSSACAAHC